MTDRDNGNELPTDPGFVINPAKMVVGEGYPFKFSGIDLILVKQPDGSIDFFYLESPDADAPTSKTFEDLSTEQHFRSSN